MLLELPEQAKEILRTVQLAGGKCYVVGGALRDLLSGNMPHDWDFASTFSSVELIYTFAGAKLIGGNCGTVQVPFGEDSVCEITPCRAEMGYSDARHPDTVVFVQDIMEDLKRRDFTVNAMAYDGEVLLDPFGGEQDLAQKVLRCVGEEDVRFAEDDLRVLRLFRFMASLGFTPEPTTWKAAVKAMPRIGLLSRERVRLEVDRILLSTRPQVLAELIEHGGLAAYGVLGKVNLDLLAEVPCEFSCRWWAFLALCEQDLDETLTAFGFSQKFKKEMDIYTKLYQVGKAKDITALKMKLRHLALNYSPLAQTFAALSSDFCGEVELINALNESKEPYHLEELAIRGEHLQRVGIRGKKCGLVLEELLKMVIQRPNLNQGTLLIQLAEQYAQLL